MSKTKPGSCPQGTHSIVEQITHHQITFKYLFACLQLHNIVSDMRSHSEFGVRKGS